MKRAQGHAMVSLIFPEQHDQVACALGRAFAFSNDPVTLKILPGVADQAERAKRLSVVFRSVLRIHGRLGRSVFGVIADDKVVVAAVTEGADSHGAGAWFLKRPGRLGPQLIRAIGLGGIYRALRLLDTLARNHPPEPHLYLNFLGVDPAYQRRHYGVALLDHLRDLAAARGELAGVYLETATEANVAYYTHAGYEVIGEIKPLGVRMWRMLQPRKWP